MGFVREKYSTLEEAKQNWEEINFGTSTSKPGDQYNHLTIIYRTKNVGRHLNVVCQCDCSEHNYINVRLDHLKNGHTKSCGCITKEQIAQLGRDSAIDITGEKIGKLTAIKPTNERSGNCVIWEFQCECGNVCYARVDNFHSFHKTACPDCRLKSYGEKIIKDILEENNIIYKREYTFDDCISLFSNRKCQFDFYVNNEYIIEFDGEQHVKPITYYGGEKTLQKNQLQDNHKNQYCFEHNIQIIRIPYTHLKDICLEDLIPETSQFLLKPEG